MTDHARPDPRQWDLGAPSPPTATGSKVARFLRRLFAALGVAGPATQSRVGCKGTWQTFEFDGATGSRSYGVYVPPAPHAGSPVPVVVLLHGCRQSAADAAAGTGLNALADRHVFVAVYPEQTKRHNRGACWNWFRPGDQRRDAGEPELIAGITRRLLDANLPVRTDPDRVYVAGLSAGGAMAAILGVTYSDLYAAVGVHSGVPYGAARTAGAALRVMRSGAGDPEQQARLARSAMGARARVVPLVVVHGDEDRKVAPGNGDSLVRQWLTLACLASGGAWRPDLDRADATRQEHSPGELPYTVHSWHDPSGHPFVEYWRVSGLGHAWSGGSRGASYVDPRGPDATEAMYRFFSQQRLHRPAPVRGIRWAAARLLRRMLTRRPSR